jgi:hypothetical protein
MSAAAVSASAGHAAAPGLLPESSPPGSMEDSTFLDPPHAGFSGATFDLTPEHQLVVRVSRRADASVMPAMEIALIEGRRVMSRRNLRDDVGATGLSDLGDCLIFTVHAEREGDDAAPLLRIGVQCDSNPSPKTSRRSELVVVYRVDASLVRAGDLALVFSGGGDTQSVVPAPIPSRSGGPDSCGIDSRVKFRMKDATTVELTHQNSMGGGGNGCPFGGHTSVSTAPVPTKR